MKQENVAYLQEIGMSKLNQKRLELIKPERKKEVIIFENRKDFDYKNLPGDLHTDGEIYQEKLDVMNRLGVSIDEASKIINEYYTSSK